MIPMDPERFSEMWSRFHLRWQNRDFRMDRIFRVVNGDWTVVAPDDETLISRSPNLVQVALKDTAEASALVPSIRVQASEATEPAKDAASMMERLGASYLDVSEFPMLAIKSFLDLYAYGFWSWVVTHTAEGGAKIEWRDPRTCFPEPDYCSLAITKRCFFARDMYMSQLPLEWQMRCAQYLHEEGVHFPNDMRVTLVEYYDEERTTIAATFNSASLPGSTVSFGSSTPSVVSVILEETENTLGMCPVVIGQVPDLDPEPHGQFDQVINILLTHIQLMAMLCDFSDDLVYSEIWVKDLIGTEMPQGGKAYIQLGPQGAIGRLPPASPSFSLFNELQMLIENFHLGARWPKTRPGDIDQAIASGKFVESTVGVMNTVIRTGHSVGKRALTQALRVAFKLEKAFGRKRRAHGILKNQQFNIEVDVSKIDPDAEVRVEYGLGFGRDPAQSAVLAIQYHQSGFVSTDTVQENLEGIVDVGLERRRLLLQQFKDMALAKLLQGLQGGTIPDGALVDMARAVQSDKDIFEVFEKFVVKPAEAQLEQQYPSALSGEMLTPGPPPEGEMGAGPQAPPPEELLAGLLGGGGGGEPPETINRLSVPLGNGSFAGSQAST